MRRRGGETITQSFDALNRLALRAVPSAASSGLGARETAWTYDAIGRILSIAETGAAWTGSQSLVNAYDTAGRLTQQARTLPATYLGLSAALTQSVSSEHDANGNRTRLTWPDGYFVQYSYDALDRMIGANENGAAALAAYTYDALSQVTALGYGNGAAIALGRGKAGDLLTLAHSWSSGGPAFTYAYTNGHRLKAAAANDNAYLFTPVSFGVTQMTG